MAMEVTFPGRNVESLHSFDVNGPLCSIVFNDLPVKKWNGDFPRHTVELPEWSLTTFVVQWIGLFCDQKHMVSCKFILDKSIHRFLIARLQFLALQCNRIAGNLGRSGDTTYMWYLLLFIALFCGVYNIYIYVYLYIYMYISFYIYKLL